MISTEFGIRNEALSSFLKLQQEIAERTRSQEELRLRNQELERLNTQLTTTKNNLESANKELERAIAK
jgi:cell division protein FtsB